MGQIITSSNKTLVLFYNIIKSVIHCTTRITQFPLKNNQRQRVAKNIPIYREISGYFRNIAIFFLNIAIYRKIRYFFDDSIQYIDIESNRIEISIYRVITIVYYVQFSYVVRRYWRRHRPEPSRGTSHTLGQMLSGPYVEHDMRRNSWGRKELVHRWFRGSFGL